MAELHEALTALSPKDWDDVPIDDLKPYMTELLTAGELICNSVPPPSEGTAFNQAKPHYDQPNGAKSHRDVYPSLARSFPPGKEHEALQKNWGKAMKFSAKENPLNIAVYKMAGHDRHGAWFARRSVHEGMSFSKFKNAMKREFAESLAVEGGPGSGSIRGIGADTRIVNKEVEGLGSLEVYQLSAQFPGPTTPREFIPLLLTSDHSLTSMSAATLSDGQAHIPRSHMILSRPVTHPDAPAREGYIRGKYESVELIREIPLSQAKPDGDSVTDTSDLNPVEWIMITRSDPGGGIPRFMVDRGTPSAMLGDVHKWLDWATNVNESEEFGSQPPEKVTPAAQEAAAATATADGAGGSENPTPAAPTATEKKAASTVPASSPPPQQEGVVSHLTQALGAGIDAYAPTMVSSYMHNRTDSNQTYDEDSDSSDVSSSDSFMSADEMRRMSTAEEHPVKAADSPAGSSQLSVTSMDTLRTQKGANHHDKEAQKLAKQREKLDRKLAKKREEEEARLRKTKESESGEQEKAKERHDREVKKSEERHRRELEKLEAKKEKEERKAAQKKAKRDEHDVVSRVTRERDEFRSQSELLKREVELLHEQIGELQKENTSMASKLGRLGGQDALSDVALKGSASSIGGRSRASTSTEK
ncbi:hypothetical protein Q7P37_004064 [Cladosporium fusiforme]